MLSGPYEIRAPSSSMRLSVLFREESAMTPCGPIRAGSRSSSIYAEGVVTRTEFSGAQFGSANSGSGRGCGSPSPERFLSEDAERAAGGEMALDVEGVEDYGVNR
jgi:hypothetical protein